MKALHEAIAAKAEQWRDIVKIGRTHMQDATPLTLGQEWSGYEGVLEDNLDRIEDALKGVFRLALGGTAVGSGMNSAPGFAQAAAVEIAAPVIVVLFCTQILLALLAKAAPQINVFVFGMPLQIAVALIGVGVAIVALPSDVVNLVGRSMTQLFGG